MASSIFTKQLLLVITLNCQLLLIVCQSEMYQLESDEKRLLVDYHNEHRDAVARGTVGDEPPGYIPHLKWSPALAKFAEKYMRNYINTYKRCPENHNPDPCIFWKGKNVHAVGENISWGSPNLYMLIKELVDEHVNFTYPNHKNFPGAVVGHYTQVVWARTRLVGCAVAQNCYKKGVLYEVMLLCNYSPAGNMGDEAPYYPHKPPRYPKGTMDGCQMKYQANN